MGSHVEYSFNVVNVEGGFIIDTCTPNNSWRRKLATRESHVKAALKTWLDDIEREVEDQAETLNEG